MSQIITNLTSLPSLRVGVSGRLRGILRDLMGRPVQDTGWIDNAILNSGIELMQFNFWNYMYIGDDGTATDLSMTGIQNFLTGGQASSSGSGGTVVPNQSSPYEGSQIWNTRYWDGDGTGTIREFGIGPYNNLSGEDCLARQVVTPEIVKGVDNILDMYYDFTFWPALGDSLANGVLIGTETYDTITRSASLKDAFTVASTQGILNGNSFAYILYDGDIGATVEDVPTGANERGRTSESYGPPTQDGAEWYRDVTVVSGIDVCNFAIPNGIGSALLRHQNGSHFQVSFKADGAGTLDPGVGIPKTDTDEIELSYRLYWGRYTP